MAWLRFVLQRLLYGAGLLLAVLVLNFLLIQLAPGDPADTIAGEMGGATPQLLAQIRAAYGLDRSLPVQLLTYLGRALRGDLGYSFFFNAPVTALIWQRMPATVLLVVTALCLAVTLGTALGVLAACFPRGLLSHAVTVLSLVGYAAPAFWLGIMLLLLFAGAVPLFPVSGMRTIGQAGGLLATAADVAHHLVLPAVTLGIIFMAVYSRLARAAMLEVLGADYVRTARAKGLPECLVIAKHALRNALIPVVTVVGLQFSQLFAGAVLVETVFNWPGLGRLAFESILRRDHPVLLGILVFSTLLVIVANLLTDVAYRGIDPRIRVGAKL
ncbi:MAG: ABC transporter permease [Candidatus Tectimicrobiota bacterium]|nr:MAG: ABC transporter permease [Candidatus Tectomicrobia bacterium]